MPDFHFVANRWPEQAEQEVRVWRAMRAVWEPFEARVWQVIGLEPTRALADPTVRDVAPVIPLPDYVPPSRAWGEAEWRVFDRIAADFQAELLGPVADPRAYADPNNGLRSVLAKEGRVGFSVGVDRALQLTRAGESMLGDRAEFAVQHLLATGFDRLTDAGRLRLTNILRLDSGDSVQRILLDAMRAGENPITTARTLTERFAAYKDWEFARLARTEVSFAQVAGQREEWQAEGFSVLRDPVGDREHGVDAGEELEPPPFHPNCICGLIPDPETGYLVYDVSALACPLCQDMLLYQDAVMSRRMVA